MLSRQVVAKLVVKFGFGVSTIILWLMWPIFVLDIMSQDVEMVQTFLVLGSCKSR